MKEGQGEREKMTTDTIKNVKTSKFQSPEPRIGVFVCHCGTNIAGFLEVPEVVEYAKTLPDVVCAQESLYTCSDSGLSDIERGIKEYDLNRVVVAACTPRTHEPLFRSTCQKAGLNPFLFEFVNIRDQCSWVHMNEREKATKKAKDVLRMGIAKARLLSPQEEIEVKVEPSAVVIGGGISGMTAALNLADKGFRVRLVEREDQIGGLMRKLHKLYPTHEEASAILEPKIQRTLSHPNIEVLTSTEVVEVKGFIGNYSLYLRKDGEDIEFTAGVIILATGARVFEPVGLYNYGIDGNVVTQLELDRMLKEGKVKANTIVMIQCVGARDEERPYCSRICCTTAIKNAILIKEANPDARIFVLFRDIQTYGAEYEEYYGQARGMGIIFIKYIPEDPPTIGEGILRVYDDLLGEDLGIEYDLLVLSTPLIPHEDAEELGMKLKVPVDANKFFLEAHVKLRPVDFATDGIYLCGCAHWPAHSGESVAQAYAAASRASIPLSRGYVKVEPIVSVVDEERCIGCGLCESMCPFKAIEMRRTERGKKAFSISASCKGCGTCGAGCPQQAITMQHFTDDQIIAQVRAAA